MKTSITKEVTVTFSRKNLPLLNTTDFSSIGISRLFFQMKYNGKLDVVSCISRICTTIEQKHTTASRELIAIVHLLTLSELIIIGSDHFFDDSEDHEPNLSCFTTRRNFTFCPYFILHKCNQTTFRN